MEKQPDKKSGTAFLLLICAYFIIERRGNDVKISVVIVVYNKSCRDSLTCSTLMQATQRPDYLLIMDNSTEDYGNAQYCEERGWQYYSMKGNAGLAKAYNAAFPLIREKTDLVVWADDDTVFPENYCKELLQSAKAHPDDSVFLPFVQSGARYISPCIAGKYRVYPVQSADELEGKPVTAINSGMAVRASVYDGYRYDETLFLDYIDHDFMRWCRIQKITFHIMQNVILKQSFFSDSKPPRKAALSRYKIFSADFRTYSKKCGNNPIITGLQLLKNRVRIEITCDRKE